MPPAIQGTINKARGSLIFTSNSQLNVTAPFLGQAGISATRNTPATRNIPTMTGTVPSYELMQEMTIEVNLLRTQFLANLYETQIQADSFIGDMVFTSDSATLTQYQYYNGTILDVAPIRANGSDAGYVVTIGAFYPVNQSAFNG